MRNRLASLLKETCVVDPNLLILSGDHGYALFDPVRKACPTQFINAGVSEQSMIGIAAGLAKSGFRPIVYGLAAFIPIRVLEFIKVDICYQSLPVVLLGDGAGLVYSTLGASHQCSEDIAVLRPLPNLKIYSPADAFELELCFQKAMEDRLYASYIRIGKSDQPAVHSPGSGLVLEGGCIKVRAGGVPIGVFATGSMSSVACQLAEEFDLTVYSVPYLSDLTPEWVETLTAGLHTLIVLEEHSLLGGLGSIVAEALVARGLQKKVHLFGLQKQFTTIAGPYETALGEHGLAPDQIRIRLRTLL